MSFFRRGDVVVVREIWKSPVWKARPWVVVHDKPEQLVLFIPKGTPTKIPPGSGIPREEWTLEDGVFLHDALRIASPGAAHSVMLFWDEGVFEGWYVNLERPLERTAVGFDYLDRELDIHVRHDRSWEYLDEDEFEEAQDLGVIQPDEAVAVRAEAERVFERIEAWDPPFCDGWERWRPERGWAVPRLLPAGWESVVT